MSTKINDWREAFTYLRGELINELLNHAGLKEEEAVRLQDGIITAFNNLDKRIKKD